MSAMNWYKIMADAISLARRSLAPMILLTILINPCGAEEPLEVFGFFQANYFFVDRQESYTNPFFGLNRRYEHQRLTFNIQQLNLFLRRELSSKLTAWVNFEVTNDFSSNDGWGSFSLEEAWVKYFHHRSLNIKAGLMIPRFNAMNEVKNRMPFLPYVIRPLVYEASIEDLMPMNRDFLPQRAYFQVYGLFISGDLQYDYALYLGNAEDDFINDDPEVTISAGADTTTNVLVGGRVGVKSHHITAGLSTSFDKDNQIPIGLGAVPRFRLGSDLAITAGRFTLESELIRVLHDLDHPELSLDKTFLYGTLSAQLSEKWLLYGSYTWLQDDFFPSMDKGMSGIYAGLAFSPNDILLKFQYARFSIVDGTIRASEQVPISLITNFEQHTLALAFSVSF